MNPAIAATRDELARWLAGFAASHVKRESPRIEVVLEAGAPGADTLGLRLALGAGLRPAAPQPPIEVAMADVADGRTRFDWCQALATRLRQEARALLAGPGQARPA